MEPETPPFFLGVGVPEPSLSPEMGGGGIVQFLREEDRYQKQGRGHLSLLSYTDIFPNGHLRGPAEPM